MGQHQCVLLRARNSETEWHLTRGKKSIKLHVSGPVAARGLHAVSAFTYRGPGIGLLASTYCDAQIATTDLYGNAISIPRFQCNLVIDRRWSAAEVVKGIRNGSGLMLTTSLTLE